jgi:hypothetical protein
MEIKIFKAPKLTDAHRMIGVAAILGYLFGVTHIFTTVVTFVTTGYPILPLFFDAIGFLAGVYFANLCRHSSNKHSSEFKKKNLMIFAFTLCYGSMKSVDTLMLLGIVKIDAVYHTPVGAVLYTNLLSEVIFGNSYCLLAMAAACILRFYPKDIDDSTETEWSTEINYEAPLVKEDESPDRE